MCSLCLPRVMSSARSHRVVSGCREFLCALRSLLAFLPILRLPRDLPVRVRSFSFLLGNRRPCQSIHHRGSIPCFRGGSCAPELRSGGESFSLRVCTLCSFSLSIGFECRAARGEDIRDNSKVTGGCHSACPVGADRWVSLSVSVLFSVHTSDYFHHHPES